MRFNATLDVLGYAKVGVRTSNYQALYRFLKGYWMECEGIAVLNGRENSTIFVTRS